MDLLTKTAAGRPKMSYPQKEGDILEGPQEVCNVVGSSVDNINRSKFWHKYTGDNVPEQECGIEGCEGDAKVGGHMWVKGLNKFCYILPICWDHNNDLDLDYPGYQWTKEDVRLVARDRGNLLRQDEMESMVIGHRLIGKYKVTKVKRQNDSKEGFWLERSQRKFQGQRKLPECQIMRCTKKATVGRRMWVERLSKFVFVVPICEDHDKDKDLELLSQVQGD